MGIFKKSISALFLFLALQTSLAAQTDEDGEDSHIVKEIIVNVDGNTSVSAVKAYIDIKEGDAFSTEEDVLYYLNRVEQDLINYRVFHTVETYTEIINTIDGFTYWRITVNVKDSWTILPIPYPKYDSNTGFRLGLKTFYNNAFGTMSDMYLGMGMTIGPNRTHGNWEVGEFNINPRWDNIRFGSILFSVGYLQSYEQQQFESEDPTKEFHYGYNRSEISIGSSVPFFRTSISYGFTASFNMQYAYKNYLKTRNYRESRFGFLWSHSLFIGNVDWIENFRTGQSASLGHGIGPVFNPENGSFSLMNTISLTGAFYKPVGKRFNYYTRGSVFFVFNSQNSGIASQLRGIADNSMSGEWGFYLNNSFAFQFWRLEGVWDAQVHPFFDIGMASFYNEVDASKELRYSAGLDFVLYLDALPNLVARGMIGVDLGRYEWNELRKYEFSITSSLHY